MGQQTPEIYRNPDGTFAKGTVANPRERPRREFVEDTLEQICGQVPPERVARIMNKMASKAEGGDVQAARLVLNVLGIEGVNLFAAGDDVPEVLLEWPRFTTDNSAEPENAMPFGDPKNVFVNEKPDDDN